MNDRDGTEIEMVSECEIKLLLAKARHVGVVVYEIWIYVFFIFSTLYFHLIIWYEVE